MNQSHIFSHLHLVVVIPGALTSHLCPLDLIHIHPCLFIHHLSSQLSLFQSAGLLWIHSFLWTISQAYLSLLLLITPLSLSISFHNVVVLTFVL